MCTPIVVLYVINSKLKQNWKLFCTHSDILFDLNRLMLDYLNIINECVSKDMSLNKNIMDYLLKFKLNKKTFSSVIDS